MVVLNPVKLTIWVNHHRCWMIWEDRSSYLLSLNPKHTFPNAASWLRCCLEFPDLFNTRFTVRTSERRKAGVEREEGKKGFSCFQFLLGSVQPQTMVQQFSSLISSPPQPHLHGTFAIPLTVGITPYCALHPAKPLKPYKHLPCYTCMSATELWGSIARWKVAFPKKPVGPKEPRFQTPPF